jgi:type II secretory pathway component PulM
MLQQPARLAIVMGAGAIVLFVVLYLVGWPPR